MKEQKITIEIAQDGKLTADAEGFTGDACMEELDKLLAGIAANQETVERKPDADSRRVSVRGRNTLTTGKKR